jgi:hypothetical protein
MDLGSLSSNSFWKFLGEQREKIKRQDLAKVYISAMKQDIRILPVIYCLLRQSFGGKKKVIS